MRRPLRVALACALAAGLSLLATPAGASQPFTPANASQPFTPVVDRSASAPPVYAPASPPASTADRSRIVITGDSTEATWLLPMGDRMETRLGYRLCGEACGQPGQPTVTNVAQGGQRLTGGTAGTNLVDQWPGIINASPRPTIIIVGIGTNDAFSAETDAEFTGAYVSIYNAARALDIRVILCEIPPLAPAHWPGEVARQRYNQWIDDHFGLAIVVRLGEILKSATATWMDPAYDIGDGVHQNAFGVLRMSDGEAARIDALV